MSNPIDTRAEQIEEEIRANYTNEEDDVLREQLITKAACFRCAVLESKLKIEQDLNRHADIRWK